MTGNYKTSDVLNPYEAARKHFILRKNRQVLIVDNQTTGRTILEKVLGQLADNTQINAFNSPLQALSWLNTNHTQADLIVTDYHMPEMNGIDFIRQVRQNPHCQHVPIIMITIASEKAVRYDALEAGVTAFLTRPVDQIECRTSCRNLLQMREQHLIVQDRAQWLAHQVKLATAQIAAREKETILRLASAGEYRDEGTGNHILRMAKYSRLIAESLGTFSKEECDVLEYAASMHDIGKIGIPDGILLKPARLDPDEWEIMKSHTTIGHAILSDSQSRYMRIGAIIALTHHERYDGKGYPNGLKGQDIPLIARVVAVADVFDALVTERPYKKAWPVDEAIAYIQNNAGSHLDPDCVDAFVRQINHVRQIQSDYADTNE